MKSFLAPSSAKGRKVVLAVGIAATFALRGIAASHGQDPPTADASAASATATHVPVTFTGGHDTDPRDRGRPVILVAGALGVAPEVFREAFSHVHPAPPGQGGPTPDEARQNKTALMDALGKYGITNDRLDEVSNRYRYVRSRGEHWPSTPAEAYAVVEKGVVTSYVVTKGGFGYSSAPTVTVPGIAGATATAQLGFSKDFDKNGAVTAIAVPGTKGK